MTAKALCIDMDDLDRPDVRALLAGHLADMHATSPPGSVHALDNAELQAPEITFWTARSDTELLGSAALKRIDDSHGEIKSMRTAPRARGRGVASQLLRHIMAEGRRRGYVRLSLETGTQAFFEPARRLYLKYGFVESPPFAHYELDPNSIFMTRTL